MPHILPRLSACQQEKEGDWKSCVLQVIFLRVSHLHSQLGGVSEQVRGVWRSLHAEEWCEGPGREEWCERPGTAFTWRNGVRGPAHSPCRGMASWAPREILSRIPEQVLTLATQLAVDLTQCGNLQKCHSLSCVLVFESSAQEFVSENERAKLCSVP